MHNCLNINWSNTDGLSLVPDDFVSINVSGMKYETLKSSIERFPSTLLGNKAKRQRYFVKSKNCYFFNRSIQCFESILFYYQSGGVLLLPPGIPTNIFEEEIAFFELGEEVLSKLRKDEGIIVEENDETEFSKVDGNLWQRRIWQLFEHPHSSTLATLVSAWSMLTIGVSITVFCLETLPELKKQVHNQHRSKILNLSSTSDDDLSYQGNKVQPWFSLELACIIWFTLEYTIRLLSSPCKWSFVTSYMNIVDFIAIVPYYITIAINKGGATKPHAVLRVVRLVRVFRVFKLSRHSVSLQILGNTLKASVRELGMMMFFLVLGVLAFSSALYYAETDMSDDTFLSIPDAFWYSLVTMTTVGYGDKVPQTLLGKLIGGVCAITGVLTIALPVPVIVSNFEFFYKRDRIMQEKRKRNLSAGKGGKEEDDHKWWI